MHKFQTANSCAVLIDLFDTKVRLQVSEFLDMTVLGWQNCVWCCKWHSVLVLSVVQFNFYTCQIKVNCLTMCQWTWCCWCIISTFYSFIIEHLCTSCREEMRNIKSMTSCKVEVTLLLTHLTCLSYCSVAPSHRNGILLYIIPIIKTRTALLKLLLKEKNYMLNATNSIPFQYWASW